MPSLLLKCRPEELDRVSLSVGFYGYATGARSGQSRLHGTATFRLRPPDARGHVALDHGGGGASASGIPLQVCVWHARACTPCMHTHVATRGRWARPEPRTRTGPTDPRAPRAPRATTTHAAALRARGAQVKALLDEVPAAMGGGYGNVFYWENIEGGHGGAADNKQRAHMWALTYDFLWQALGPESDRRGAPTSKL